ncbi:MAG: 1,4-dihydroxy-6-naphthoate synthase [Bacteroidota bacterium]
MTKLSLGFSPCPNDTFIFDAMIHGKIDTEGLEFEVHLADVEELNQKALNNELNITKLSYHAYAHLNQHYQLLQSGSALGHNCGPLLIAKGPMTAAQINSAKIAIPGQLTTANFLLSLAYPQATNKSQWLFSTIEQAVLDGEVDAGLIIHESRFTYEAKGLVKLIDLGEYWEQQTAMPIPLGGIAIQRQIANEIQQKVDRVLQRSVRFAWDHPDSSSDCVSQHAQEMEESVMQQHIALYVNEYTDALGEKGRKAIDLMYKKADDLEIIPKMDKKLFVG